MPVHTCALYTAKPYSSVDGLHSVHEKKQGSFALVNAGHADQLNLMS